MAKQDKIIEKFLSKPKDFTWKELVKLLDGLGYKQVSEGKTGGSRVRFVHRQKPPICLHKPHPTPVLKRYQISDILNFLKQEGLL